MSESDVAAISTKSLLETIGDSSQGIGFGEMVVDDRGQLAHFDRENFDFTFRYRGGDFRVRARAEGTTTAMDLEVDLGLLPYSVESVDVRANALAVIDAARGIIADAGIGGDQRVRLRDHIQIEEPPSPVVMLGAATLFAVRTRPYLDLICLFTGRLNAA